ncbi:succinate semialdehyde dehydrogenase [Moesziomyces antarcticus]|uniref:Related to aldehyde dehydrogenase n=2 Tax=Pseudozyma antarctica TaxID=84753 RepID=A0A5C3FP13_PSEA2|nr:succinate semialdehyde dehydrogenase [Moesziomyces antarcticus]GAK65167.1 succinate semialdehyde dehydrogenase [Moesziomyces antarcticus]SPO46168.1 related to aldehyde dehydrogenase [Moesziomyces antarcticus]
MSSSSIQTTIAPYDQSVVCEKQLLSAAELDQAIDAAATAQKSWAKVSVKERVAIITKWMALLDADKEALGKELSEQMGRPASQCAGEIKGALQRCRYLCKVAEECLADSPRTETETPNLKLAIRRDPFGVVGIVTPWNYPYLTTVNGLITALLAGNAVVLKPSPQTPLTAESFQRTLEQAGLPKGLLHIAHLDFETTAKLAAHPRIGFLIFTGSVAGGKALAKAAADGPGFKGVGLELGGKDPAYVRADADIKWAAEELVDGAMFNSGQSCCSVERIYVHASVFDEFVNEFVGVAKQYKLGDPSQSGVSLGPVVSLASAERIRKQVDDALSKGAKNLIPAELFPEAKAGTALVAPTVLVDVDHSMEIMTEETFGPAIGIMKVSSDDEALQLMNDSHYGLTASVWTNIEDAESAAAFDRLATELETGTVYLNRADVLDPALPWTGVKDSGRGVSLSTLGFDQLTQPKAIHMRLRKA